MSTYAQPIITSCIYYSEAFEKLFSTEFRSTTNEFPKGFSPVSFWCGIFYFSCLHDSWIPCSLLAAMRCIQMFISAMHKSGFKCIFMLKYFLFVFKTLTRTFQDGLQLEKTNVKFLKHFFFSEFQVFWIGLFFCIEKSSLSLFFHVCLFGTAWNYTNIFTQSSFCWVYYRVTVPYCSFITCCSALVFGALVNEWARLLKPNWACFEHTIFAHLFFNDVWIVKKNTVQF